MITLRLLKIPSLSAWRAWIEIIIRPKSTAMPFGRSPLGERGLKSIKTKAIPKVAVSRSPLGERGLKYLLQIASNDLQSVALRLESVD